MSIPAKVPDILFQGTIGTSNTDTYVVPEDKKATITAVHITNTSIANITVTLYIVQAGNIASNANIIGPKEMIIEGTSSPQGGGYMCFSAPDWAIPLNTVGDKLVGISNSSGLATITIIGYEEAV